MRSGQVQILFKALFLSMLFSSILIPQEYSRICGLVLKDKIAEQTDANNISEYFQPSENIAFGYNRSTPESPAQLFRSIYEVEIPRDLPPGAYLKKIELVYKNSSYYEWDKFEFLRFPISLYENTWDLHTKWEITEGRLPLGQFELWSGNPIAEEIFDLLGIVDDAVKSGKTKLYLGFCASPESGEYSIHVNNFVSVSLKYTYEFRVNHTLKNSNNFGKIDVNFNNLNFEYESGKVLCASVGSNIKLRAKEEQFDGTYYWVWNQDPNTLDATKSNWTITNGEVPSTSSILYSYTAKQDYLFSSFTANLKRKFLINRIDKTEFDGNFQTSDVARVVEQNSVNVPYSETMTKTTRTYSFAGWEDGGGTLRTPTDNATYTAIYKIPNKSNTSTAFSNTSQRKFIKSDNGYLHLVYESMNHIWYERSTDNGLNWQIMNGGKCLDQGATESKLPSITTINDNVAIVWQEEYVGYYKIMLARFDENSVLRYTTVVYDPAGEFADKPLYSTSADPVIAFNAAATVLVCWKKEIPGNPEASGIWYKLGQADLDYNGTNRDVSRWYQEDMIPGTTMNSYTPTLTLSFLGQEFALAWEQREYYGSIAFARLSYGASNGVYIINNISQETVSNWSYYQYHHKPSLALIPSSSGGGNLELGWVGEKIYYENGVQKTKKNALYRRCSYSASTNTWNWAGVTWSMGSSNVSAVNVNTTNTDGVVGWNEGGVNNRYARTSSPYTTRLFTIGHDLNGASLQINNSTDFNSMYALVLDNSAIPYSFVKSWPIAQIGKNRPRGHFLKNSHCKA